MNNVDNNARSEALEWALKLYEDSPTVVSPDLALQAAEKFRVFLSGQSVEPEPLPEVKDERLTFELPRLGDGYTYARFEDTGILYRSNHPRLVERINAKCDTKWQRVTGSLNTTNALLSREDYHQIGAGFAAKILIERMDGVRFV